MEALLAVGLLTILLSVSALGITGVVRRLKIAELDNAAREIYMAAQNQAVLLSSNGRLLQGVQKPLPGGSQGQYINQMEHVPVDEIGSKEITAYYVAKADAGQLLSEESIDPTLWQGDFYIVYEPESASVLDVFFAEEPLTEAAADFRTFYDTYRFMSREERSRLSPRLGHFGGEGAEVGRAVKLPAPLIRITNTETLTVEVSYRVPLSLAANLRNNLTYTTTLSYEQGGQLYGLRLQTATVSGGLAYQSCTSETSLEQGFTAYTYTYLLDSLQPGAQFADLALQTAEGSELAGNVLGGDFTVTALLDVDGSAGLTAQVDAGKAEASDNSLFAKGSGGETAYIEYARHLQNLDIAISHVGGKTAAEQRQDISGETIAAFKPIENDKICAYNGNNCVLRGFAIGLDTSSYAGLFAEIKGDDSARPWQFGNVRLVNSYIHARDDNFSAAGALAGTAENAVFTNCWVYWEKETPADLISDHLWDSAKNDLSYAVSGGTAGGLLGVDNGGVTLENCLAATTLRGNTAGGLIGSVSGAKTTVHHSYADSYLAGSQVGGLAGRVASGATLELENCYAAGFIAAEGEGASAAGLAVNQQGSSIAVSGAYSAILYGGEGVNAPLFTVLPDTAQNLLNAQVYYLDSASLREPAIGGESLLKRTYNDLTDPTLANNPLNGSAFAFKTQDESRPYNVQPGMALARYEYPGLVQLPHYGDWGMEFRDGTLVYYEQYEDGTFGLYGRAVNTLQSDGIVVQDGYAVAYQGLASSSQLEISLDLYYQDESGAMMTEPKTVLYSTAGGGSAQPIYTIPAGASPYYIAPLPGEVVNAAYTSADYFQQIRFEQTVNDTTYVGHYYYNPHFAGGPDTLLEYEEGLDIAAKAASIAVPVRSARHLYSLGRYKTYSAGTHEYTFVQQLDIDYSSYTGYGLFEGQKDANNAVRQRPIGPSSADPFRNVYNGNYHLIKGVVPRYDDDTQYLGLFGYSFGRLENIVYQLSGTPLPAVSRQGRPDQPLYLGGLVAANEGIVSNCAVFGMQVQAHMYDYSQLYLGGLVGVNRSFVTGCSAEVRLASLDSHNSAIYAGGFAGENSSAASIEQSYAVGRITASRSGQGAAQVAGFAGQSRSVASGLSRCYSAMDLKASGGGSTVYGFAGGPSSGCCYLNGGNFTYDAGYSTPAFNAGYADQSAAGKRFSELAASAGMLGMAGRTYANEPQESENIYPYPGTVRDAAGGAVHYGGWPVTVELGEAGVFYWEKMTFADSAASYRISTMSVSSADTSMLFSQKTTLSTAHDDGGVVTDYGYGVFCSAGYQDALSIQMQGISWWDTVKNTTLNGVSSDLLKGAGYVDADVSGALASLMEGKYTFYAYHTRSGENETSHAGLCPDHTSTSCTAAGGLITLSGWQNSARVTFRVNPFFAEAMQLQNSAGQPGSEARPFGVRSVRQFKFINWNQQAQDTITVLNGEAQRSGNSSVLPDGADGAGENFPYLCRNGYTAPLYWQQTHDITGRSGMFYTPVAEYYDPSADNWANLTGWFGGSYNGGGYMIENLNIQGQRASCAGLFGVVYNGSLQNIVLYSSDGTGEVCSGRPGQRGWAADNNTQSRWYAIGALAGVAGSDGYSVIGGNAIINCAVAGYKIDAHLVTDSGGWGGGTVGGLAGVCNMDLTGCSAVSDLVLNINQANDNVRVGGLVGATQKQIISCYAGGTIRLDAIADTTSVKKPGVYLGGLVGGSYFKPLKIQNNVFIGANPGSQTEKDNTSNAITNCYSYVSLPNPANTTNGQTYVGSLYALGGTGEINPLNTSDGAANHGVCTITNSYYLASEALSSISADEIRGSAQKTDLDAGGVSAVTFEGLAGPDMCGRLDANTFHPVTTLENGITVNGKYSYPPKTYPWLEGSNYPFPAVLHRDANLPQDSAGGPAGGQRQTVYVHYGRWPVQAISRQSGAAPLRLDLFASYDIAAGSAFLDERLILAGGLPTNGSYAVTSADPAIAAGEVNTSGGSPVLRVTGFKNGSTTLTVTYTVTVSGSQNTYTLDVPVYVSAQLRLRLALPDAGGQGVFYTNERAEAALEPVDQNGRPLPDELKKAISFKPDTLQLEFDHNCLQTAAAACDEHFTSAGLSAQVLSQPDLTTVNLSYGYTYAGADYTDASVINLRLQPCPLEPVEGYDIALDGAASKMVDLELANRFSAGIPADMEGLQIEPGGCTSASPNLFVADRKADDPAALTLTAYADGLGSADTGTGVLAVNYLFVQQGVTHHRTLYLDVNVYRDAITTAALSGADLDAAAPDAAPDETGPDGTAPDDAGPGSTAPEEPGPAEPNGEPSPAGPAPDETGPAGTAPDDADPGSTAPEEPSPADPDGETPAGPAPDETGPAGPAPDGETPAAAGA